MHFMRQYFSPMVSRGRVILLVLGVFVGLSFWFGPRQSSAAFEQVENLALRELSAGNIQQYLTHSSDNQVCSTQTLQTPSEPQPYKVYLPLVSSSNYTDPNAFYVSENGDDVSGDGSSSNPWGTINHALNQVPDGALVLVKPGTYTGMITYERMVDQGITLRSEVPYMARLRNNAHVIQVYHGRHLTIEGFDISHIGPGADRYVIQIQDPDGAHQCGSYIVLRNNIIHDSYNNDLVKVNNNASHITIEGNIFYNMGGPETDSHLDINSVDYVLIQDNIFFNDYEGSGRINESINGHFIVLKDSNGDSDGHIGTNEVTIRRNIFLNWQGNQGNAFIGLGDSSVVDYFQAQNIMIENNLMLGNASNQMHAVLKATNTQGVVFRSNTIVGDLPSNAYFIRTCVANPDTTNDSFEIYNNIWSDPTGTMGSGLIGEPNDFSISPESTILSFTLANNLYWNGQKSVPAHEFDGIQYNADSNAFLVNPQLPDIPTNITLPRLNPVNGLLGGQFHSVREVFVYLVQTYGTPAGSSPVIDKADPLHTPDDDILGLPRQAGGLPDLGAVEIPK